MLKVSAKTKEKPEAVTVEYNLPASLGDMTEVFGEEVVTKAAQGAIIISLQAFMRRHIEKGTPLAELQKEVTAWRPDVRTVSKQSAFEKAASALDKLAPEDRKTLLARLQAAK